MIRYEWTDVAADMTILIDKISIRCLTNDYDLQTIVGIQRGGLIPAVMLSHWFDIPMDVLEWQTRDGNKNANYEKLFRILESCQPGKAILIVDEIADSGRTLIEIQKQVDSFNAAFNRSVQVYFAVMVKRMSCRLEFPVISAHDLYSKDWVHFPWESV